MSSAFRTDLRSAHRVAYAVLDFAGAATSPHEVAARVRSWLDSAEMRELFGLFDRVLTGDGLQDRLAEADAVTAEIFDFRQGNERWEARKSDLPAGVEAAIDAVVDLLLRAPGSTEVAGPKQATHCLVLGGRVNSCLLRADLLADLLDEGWEIGRIWGLGSRRAVVEDEREFARQLGLGPIDDELDGMCASLSYSLGLPRANPDPERPPSEVRLIDHVPRSVVGLAAEPGPGKLRATTTDTYRFFLDSAGTLSCRDTLLIVTSAIHAPFQHAQALAALGLPTGARLVTVGAHIGTSRIAALRRVWTSAEWLQEIRSAIWSMRQMYEAFLAVYPDLE